jgi:4-hydroxy-3-methylbut-2-enyl diphosphate reductase
MRARHINIIDTTCPFVRRAQLAARRLAKSGFLVIVYGDGNHPEVKGILGWADGNGLATLDDKVMANFDKSPRRLGILSQTTQIRANFVGFIRNIIDSAFVRDSELRVINTICHDVRKRQEAALDLAEKVDLMIVIGGHTSANTNHLTQLCSTVTKTHLIETAADVQPSLLKGHRYIGVTSGASTAERTINQVVARLADTDLLMRGS